MMFSSCPFIILKLQPKVAFVCETLGPGGSEWSGKRLGNCTQFPEVCVNRAESAKMRRI